MLDSHRVFVRSQLALKLIDLRLSMPSKSKDREDDTVSREEFDRLRRRVDSVDEEQRDTRARLKTVGRVACQAGRAGGEERASRQFVCFLCGAVVGVLEAVLATYESDKAAVAGGDKQRGGVPLKLRVHTALVEFVVSRAGVVGGLAVEAAKALADFTADGALAACSFGSKPSSGPWVVVFTVNHGGNGHQLKALWAAQGLRGVWARDGLGFKPASWKPPKDLEEVAEWVGFNMGGKGGSSSSGSTGSAGRGKQKGAGGGRRDSVQPTKKSRSEERG